mgnify:CR=1 FL=1
MQKVKVFNDNTFDFKSNFKGDPVHIKAKSYWKGADGNDLIMDIYEANDFRGDYHPIKIKGDGTHDPESFKMIKLEKLEDAKEGLQNHICMVCNHKSPSSHELDAHVKFTHAEVPKVVIPELDNKKKTA